MVRLTQTIQTSACKVWEETSIHKIRLKVDASNKVTAYTNLQKWPSLEE